MQFPRGSEWRRWDLHVHTPFSVLNNAFGSDFPEYARRVVEAAHANRIAAIGVTDYFSVEGYRQMKLLLADNAWLATLTEDVRAHATSLLILANVELRGFVITDDERRDSRVNFHVLFADDLSATDIERDFLSQLHFTAASAPGRQDERWPLTQYDLASLGERLKEQHADFTQPPIEVGMMNAVIDHVEVSTVLANQRSRFEGKHLLIAPIDEDLADLRWDGQGHLTRKLFVQKSHMIFSTNPGTRDFALGRRHQSVDAYLAEFVSRKPCVHGSDAHEFNALFQHPERRFTWIRSDPTFRGLMMLLTEPADRVYVGAEPPQLESLTRRRANTIDAVTIQRADGAATTERWFDNSLVLNSGMCAIIGNRGNGKSALAEVVALLGDTKRVDSFSFLSTDRFRHPRIGKADDFAAEMTWRDGTKVGPRLLSSAPASTAVERVRYIGQGFLDEICNEMDRGESSRFYHELQEVIFSHVPVADRQGHRTLAALLAYLGEGIAQEVGGLHDEVAAVNRRTLGLIERMQPTYRAALEAQLHELRRQLAALDARQPTDVPEPPRETTTPEGRVLDEEVQGFRARINSLDVDLGRLGQEDAELAARRAAASRLLDRIRAVEASVRAFVDEGKDDARLLGIEIESTVRLVVDWSPVQVILQETDARRAAIGVELDPAADGTAGQRTRVVEQLAAAEERLTLPEQRYQEFLDARAAWNAERALLVGTPQSPESIEGVAAQIVALESLPDELARTTALRRDKVLDIYAAKQRLKGEYERLHRPVGEFLEDSPLVAAESLKLRFEANIVEDGFADTFLAMINQRRQGAFAGVDEGRVKLDRLTSEVDWSSPDQAATFPETVLSMLYDGDQPRTIDSALRQGFDAETLLDYLFGLDYLLPTYKLSWDGRAVSELSPGERGALLLVFYLLVDRNDIPLVIDQPEENLDNQTVYKTLVPCVRDARLRRQIVVVTHNPNLAVVCDADQIIYAEITKDGSNAVQYQTGSIEDPAIAKRIVDVLEGTKPAFDQRAVKYELAG